jgi:alpha-D-ribose 1-methylphosphonate 5-phosphate C-P lyase
MGTTKSFKDFYTNVHKTPGSVCEDSMVISVTSRLSRNTLHHGNIVVIQAPKPNHTYNTL